MTNLEIAWVLQEIADLLELADENPFKARAYRRAARVVLHLHQDVIDLWQSGSLLGVPAIGKNTAARIGELIQTGHSTYLEGLRERIPPGLREMLSIPGLGVKSIRIIHQALGIITLEELTLAARERRIRQLPGMGNKTELAILRGVDMIQNNRGLVPLGIAQPLAEQVAADLRELPEVERVEIAGDVRRGQEMVREVIILAATTRPAAVVEVFVRHPWVREVLARETAGSRVLTRLGLPLELVVVPPAGFAAAWLYRTGSTGHFAGLRERAAALGLQLGENGLTDRGEGENMFAVLQEEDIYRRLEMEFVPPELREDSGELAAAIVAAEPAGVQPQPGSEQMGSAGGGRLPAIVDMPDIRGDLHMHTNWSDGVDSMEEMARAARRKGYEYIAITDHSRSLTIANGLSLERLEEQQTAIDRFNEQSTDLRILAGVEVDILADGRLDYPDEVLAGREMVIASLHTGFHMDGERMTARAEQALKNPHVDILAHPTGRILGRRDAYELDLERVMELASKTGTWLEINSSPDRLDLSDTHARAAREMGIPIAINTDAHDVARLDEMRFGVQTARRGWLEPKDVVNTWSLAKVQARRK